MIREKNHKNTWQATVLTLFPNMFPSVLGQSLAGNALKTGIWSLKTLDIRGFAGDKHRSVDAPPFGGGAGMVLRADTVDAALASVENVPAGHPCSHSLEERPIRLDHFPGKQNVHWAWLARPVWFECVPSGQGSQSLPDVRPVSDDH